MWVNDRNNKDWTDEKMAQFDAYAERLIFRYMMVFADGDPELARVLADQVRRPEPGGMTIRNIINRERSKSQ